MACRCRFTDIDIVVCFKLDIAVANVVQGIVNISLRCLDIYIALSNQVLLADIEGRGSIEYLEALNSYDSLPSTSVKLS